MPQNDQAIQQIIQSLLMPQVQPSAPMMGSMGAPAPTAPTFLSMLPSVGDRPAGSIHEINPGMTWNGQDTNAILPNTLMGNALGRPYDQERL